MWKKTKTFSPINSLQLKPFLVNIVPLHDTCKIKINSSMLMSKC